MRGALYSASESYSSLHFEGQQVGEDTMCERAAGRRRRARRWQVGEGPALRGRGKHVGEGSTWDKAAGVRGYQVGEGSKWKGH